jgi:hypothetical protein
MKLDTRSEMALNLILGMGMSVPESLRTLAFICRGWGLSASESCPLARELTQRMGLSHEDAVSVMKKEVKRMDVNLAISNQVN